jgi:hypothetical protein
VLCSLHDEYIDVGNCHPVHRLATLPKQRQKNAHVIQVSAKGSLCDAAMAATKFAILLEKRWHGSLGALWTPLR